MADADNFEDELFADLYNDDEPQTSSSKPATASVPAQAQPKTTAAAAPAAAQAPAQQDEDYGDESHLGGNSEYDDTMHDDYDDDDDVDFNLGNGNASSANNANTTGHGHGQRAEETSQPGGGHYSDARSGGPVRAGGSNSKEDG